MLIIEGPDLVGKTTLALAVTKLLGQRGWPAVYRHFTKLPPCWDYFADYLPHVSRFAVMDRFWQSEPVYAEVRGTQTPLTPGLRRALDARLQDEGSLSVVVTATAEFLREQWKRKDREEMYGYDQVLQANLLYDREYPEAGRLGCDVRVRLCCDQQGNPQFCAGDMAADIATAYLNKQRARGHHPRATY